MEHNNKKLT